MKASGISAHEAQLQLVIDAAPVLISYVDTSYRYRIVNKAYQTWLGYHRDDVIGRQMNEVLCATAWGIVGPKIARAMVGENVTFEAEIPYRNIGTRWVKCTYTPDINLEGRVIGVAVLVLDLTDHMRIETDLRTSETYHRSLFEAAGVGNSEVDLTTGRFLRVNRKYCEIVGYTAEELLAGMTFLEITHPDDRDENIRSLQSFIDGHSNAFQMEKRYRRKDGRDVWVHIASTIVRDETNRPIRLLGVSQDISERERAEQLLKEADIRKDEFLATLAHELRNPLAPISNALQIWSRVENDREKVQQIRAMMGRQVEQLKRLIDDLLDVSRIQRGKIELHKERVNLITVVEEAIEAAQPFIDASSHTLTVELPQAGLMVEGDHGRLIQVFGNLINNAAKYTAHNGRIRVSGQIEGANAIVRVCDNGSGIPQEMLTAIFEAFTQVNKHLDRAQGGLGIGLTLVKTLVEMHGGTVEATSDGRGRGSEFIVRLPLLKGTGAGAPHLPQGDTIRSATPMLLHRNRVLVVDDMQPSADTLAMMLEELGQEVRVVYDGFSALKVLKEFHPEVVFSDIAMPGMDGYYLAQRIRQEYGRRPMLVALTGYGQEHDRLGALEAGFNNHLVKPTTLEALRELLTAAPTDHDGTERGISV